MINKNETVIQNEQQSQEVVINEIINIIAKNNYTIEEAEKIVRNTLKQINQQTVRAS